MNISKITILFIFFTVCGVVSCDSPTDAPNATDEFSKLTILPAPGYYPVGSTLTMSFTGVTIDTAKYIYRWTVNDTLEVDSTAIGVLLHRSGRIQVRLRMYGKHDTMLLKDVKSVYLASQQKLTIDSLSKYRYFHVSFGGYGTIEIKKDSIVNRIDTVFGYGTPKDLKVSKWIGNNMLVNEEWSETIQTRFTQTYSFESLITLATLDTSLQQLVLGSFSYSRSSSRNESVSIGMLSGGSSASLELHNITMYCSEVNTAQGTITFELPSNNIPDAIDNIRYSSVTSGVRWPSWEVKANEYVLLTSISRDNSIRPYIRVTFYR